LNATWPRVGAGGAARQALMTRSGRLTFSSCISGVEARPALAGVRVQVEALVRHVDAHR